MMKAFALLYACVAIFSIWLLIQTKSDQTAKLVEWSGRKLVTVDFKEDGPAYTFHQLEYGWNADTQQVVTRPWGRGAVKDDTRP